MNSFWLIGCFFFEQLEQPRDLYCLRLFTKLIKPFSTNKNA